MKKRFLRRLKENERGASLVEFAIIVPILLALLIGIVEFGWILNGYITITGAAREGARTAVALSENAASETDIIEAVENHLGYLKDHLINLNVDPGEAESGDARTVKVMGNLPVLVGFFPFLGEDVLITGESTMRQESAIQEE